MALVYGTSTAMTITAASLASGAARSSAAVTTDTTKNIAQIMLSVSVLTTSTAPTGNKQVLVYAYMSSDGTTFLGNSGTTDNVDGTDKALTALGSPTNLRLLGTMQLNQGAVAVTQIGTFEVTGAFGCVPPKWGFVLVNDAGVALGATISASYREVSYS